MCSNSMINRILLAASAVALSLLAACSGPIRVPIQPQPQAPAFPVLVNPFGQLVLDQSRPAIGAQFVPLPGRKSEASQSGAVALLSRLLNSPKR